MKLATYLKRLNKWAAGTLRTAEETAKYLGIAPKTLNNWVSERRIASVKLGGCMVGFAEEDIQEFIRKRYRPAV